MRERQHGREHVGPKSRRHLCVALAWAVGFATVLASCSGARPEAAAAVPEHRPEPLAPVSAVRLEQPLALLDPTNGYPSLALVHDGAQGKRLFCLAPQKFVYAVSIGLAEANPQLVDAVPTVYASFLRRMNDETVAPWFDLDGPPPGVEHTGGGTRSHPNTPERGRPWVPDSLDFAFRPGGAYQPVGLARAGDNIAIAWFEMQQESWVQGELLIQLVSADTLESLAQPVRFDNASSFTQLHAVADLTGDGVNELCVAGACIFSTRVHVLDGSNLRTLRETTFDPARRADGSAQEWWEIHCSWVEPGGRSLAIPKRPTNVSDHWSVVSMDLTDDRMALAPRGTLRFGERGVPSSVSIAGGAASELIAMDWAAPPSCGDRPCGWSVVKGYTDSAEAAVTLADRKGPCFSYTHASCGPEWIADLDGDGYDELLVANPPGALQVRLSTDFQRPLDVTAPDGWSLEGGFYATAAHYGGTLVILRAVRIADSSKWLACAPLVAQ